MLFEILVRVLSGIVLSFSLGVEVGIRISDGGINGQFSDLSVRYMAPFIPKGISGSVPLAHFAEAARGIMAQLADNKGLIFHTLTFFSVILFLYPTISEWPSHTRKFR